MEMMILTALIGITNLCVGYALAIWMGVGPVPATDLEAEFGAFLPTPAAPATTTEPAQRQPEAAAAAEKPEEVVLAAPPADSPPADEMAANEADADEMAANETAADETAALPSRDESAQPVIPGDTGAIEAALAGLVQELVSLPLDEIGPEPPAAVEADSVSPALENTAAASAP
ncbi:MAG: hypothetical protein KJZ87_24680 [Thermoguttaceae bacterium]|nr:hypothetical protein [Thermoguttaceae bacterium]